MDRRILAIVGGIALVISACSSSGGGGSSAAASAAGAPSAAASAGRGAGGGGGGGGAVGSCIGGRSAVCGGERERHRDSFGEGLLVRAVDHQCQGRRHHHLLEH